MKNPKFTAYKTDRPAVEITEFTTFHEHYLYLTLEVSQETKLVLKTCFGKIQEVKDTFQARLLRMLQKKGNAKLGNAD